MNESQERATPDLPTPEQLVGRQVRLLRRGRGWSQLEIAQKMRAYGYQWSPATVTRLEAATRPIRLNEVFDLAALFEVPATQFLDRSPQGIESDDPEAMEREIAQLVMEQDALGARQAATDDQLSSLMKHSAVLRAELARIDGRLEILARWYPAARKARETSGLRPGR